MSPAAKGSSQLCVAGVKYPLGKAVEATKQAMDGVGGQGKVMLEDKFDNVND